MEPLLVRRNIEDLLQMHWSNGQGRIPRNDQFEGMSDVAGQRDFIGIFVEQGQRDQTRVIRLRVAKRSQRFQCGLNQRTVAERNSEKEQTRSRRRRCPERFVSTRDGMRTRAFSAEWISRLKRESVEITSKDMNIDEVFIRNRSPIFRCTFNAFVTNDIKPVICFVIRSMSESASKASIRPCRGPFTA